MNRVKCIPSSNGREVIYSEHADEVSMGCPSVIHEALSLSMTVSMKESVHKNALETCHGEICIGNVCTYWFHREE